MFCMMKFSNQLFDDFINVTTQMILYIHLHRRCTRQYHLLGY